MNLKLVIAFDGTDFYGWQYQPDRRSVSGEIMGVFSRLVDGDFKLIGCGRTDAGVHAVNYVANVKVFGRLRVPVGSLSHKLNRMLPEEVFVKSVEPVSESFHARFSARYKVYRYLFSSDYDPLLRRRVWFVKSPPSPQILNRQMEFLIGEHDFKVLSADERENGVCRLYDITFGRWERGVFMDVKGNRFLRKMVRFMASLSVLLSEGRISPEEARASFLKGERIKGLSPAPPWGLYLLEVGY